MMETYKTITTKITEVDKSTNNQHRDNIHSENQNYKQGDRKVTFNTATLTATVP